MSADMIVEELASKGILKRTATIKSKPNSDGDQDENDNDQPEDEKRDGKVNNIIQEDNYYNVAE